MGKEYSREDLSRIWSMPYAKAIAMVGLLLEKKLLIELSDGNVKLTRKAIVEMFDGADNKLQMSFGEWELSKRCYHCDSVMTTSVYIKKQPKTTEPQKVYV